MCLFNYESKKTNGTDESKLMTLNAYAIASLVRNEHVDNAVDAPERTASAPETLQGSLSTVFKWYQVRDWCGLPALTFGHSSSSSSILRGQVHQTNDQYF